MGFIIAGVSLVPLLLLPETYGPVILKKRAQKMRKETGNSNIFAPIELEKKGAKQMLTITLTRPLRMIVFEAIVLFTCLYLSLAYAIFCKLSSSRLCRSPCTCLQLTGSVLRSVLPSISDNLPRRVLDKAIIFDQKGLTF